MRTYKEYIKEFTRLKGDVVRKPKMDEVTKQKKIRDIKIKKLK